MDKMDTLAFMAPAQSVRAGKPAAEGVQLSPGTDSMGERKLTFCLVDPTLSLCYSLDKIISD
jgi:hypothetical protein